MTRVLGLDLETTGRDTKLDRITEIGAVLWEVETKKPLLMISSLIYLPDYPKLTKEINEITGITDDMLIEFGQSPYKVVAILNELCHRSGVSYIVAHNGSTFDRPLLVSELDRQGLVGEDRILVDLPLIDTLIDLPFENPPQSRKLSHMAMDAGFLNPFPHRALFDVLTMLRVMSQFSFESILEYAKIPFITVRACVDYDNREVAKANRYSWEKLGEKTYSKMWVKKVKATHLEMERARLAPFKVGVLEGGEYVKETGGASKR